MKKNRHLERLLKNKKIKWEKPKIINIKKQKKELGKIESEWEQYGGGQHYGAS